MNSGESECMFEGKRILVTGGTGSFGRYITNALLQQDVREIRIFSRDEEKQLDMQREISDSRMSYFIGDIRDGQRTDEVFKGVDIVYHAAALKIIPVGELNSWEVIKTNIMGTENVKKSCISCGVSEAVLVSTDKAVKPVNLYGMTKGVAEKVWLTERPKSDCKFSVVRYGNVIGSRGSIVPYFRELYAAGKPIPITHPDMTRFLISLRQAIDLVFTATGREGYIFVPKIPSARVVDIAEAIAGPGYPTTIIGIRPGEKLHECLINEYEIHTTVFKDPYYIIGPGGSTALTEEYTSQIEKKMTVGEIKEALKCA